MSAAAGEEAGFAQTYDEQVGIVRIVGRGFWTEAMIDSHFGELGRLVERVRGRGDDILALVDLGGAPVQRPGVAARITAHTRRIYRPEDRIAIVVGSSLVKMQIKRAVEGLNLEAFLSPDAALTWLTAHRMPVRMRMQA
jgi:hypothetical protein